MKILSWIGEVLSSFLNVFVSIFSFLGSAIESLWTILNQLPKLISTLSLSIGFLPQQYIAPITLVISISAIYWIINKER